MEQPLPLFPVRVARAVAPPPPAASTLPTAALAAGNGVARVLRVLRPCAAPSARGPRRHCTLQRCRASPLPSASLPRRDSPRSTATGCSTSPRLLRHRGGAPRRGRAPRAPGREFNPLAAAPSRCPLPSASPRPSTRRRWPPPRHSCWGSGGRGGVRAVRVGAARRQLAGPGPLPPPPPRGTPRPPSPSPSRLSRASAHRWRLSCCGEGREQARMGCECHQTVVASASAFSKTAIAFSKTAITSFCCRVIQKQQGSVVVD